MCMWQTSPRGDFEGKVLGNNIKGIENRDIK
jgi:hypothetical protein